jgi:F-type H+-transporting ATPase subunit gamma
VPHTNAWLFNYSLGINSPVRLVDSDDAMERVTLRALIRGYLFISVFRACAESLDSENASRLSAMERADHSIKDLLTKLNGDFNRIRQDSIDEELFDVISGFEALTGPSKKLGDLTR